MILHSVGLSISLQGFGLRSFSHAVALAFTARYFFAPPCLLISRLIVEEALDSLFAITLMLIFATSALDISSLSSSDSANGCRFRTGGRYPPVWWIVGITEEGYLSNILVISCRESPCLYLSQIIAFCSGV